MSELHKFLRPEMQFESVEALKTAIEENVQPDQRLFRGMRKGDIAVERGIAFCVMQNGKLT